MPFDGNGTFLLSQAAFIPATPISSSAMNSDLSDIANGLTDLYGRTRDVLTTGRTYYCRTDGSDSNTGLANNPGGAFLTIQHAWNVILTLDLAGHSITIQLGAGMTFTGGLVASLVNTGSVTLDGGGSTISTTGANCIFVNGCYLGIQNVTLTTTTSGHCIYGINRATIAFGAGVVFGAAAAGNIHIRLDAYATLSSTSNYSITGSASSHYQVSGQASLGTGGITVTLSGTLAFTYFADAEGCAFISNYATTFTGGTITGQRYLVASNAVINVYGGGANVYPGSVAGASATGGQYL